jgi:predicted nucleic acid-binding protein
LSKVLQPTSTQLVQQRLGVLQIGGVKALGKPGVNGCEKVRASARWLCSPHSRARLVAACIHEFLAVVTHPCIYALPTPLARALDQVGARLESPTLTLLTESTARWPTLLGLLADGHIAGAQVHDGRVAALCRQHGVRELWSADRDFSRFAGVAVVNPMAHAS